MFIMKNYCNNNLFFKNTLIGLSFHKKITQHIKTDLVININIIMTNKKYDNYESFEQRLDAIIDDVINEFDNMTEYEYQLWCSNHK